MYTSNVMYVLSPRHSCTQKKTSLLLNSFLGEKKGTDSSQFFFFLFLLFLLFFYYEYEYVLSTILQYNGNVLLFLLQ